MGGSWQTMARRDGLSEMVARVERQIASGPPEGLRVSAWTWRQFLMSGGVFCPADRRHCQDANCCLGTRCATIAAEKGLTSDGSPLARSERPLCGARTRAGGSCAMRLEPGSHRCRLHGGKSTGPKTAEGRARIAEAQRRRWAIRRGEPVLTGR